MDHPARRHRLFIAELIRRERKPDALLPHEQQLLLQLRRQPYIVCVKKRDITSPRLPHAVIAALRRAKILLIPHDPNLIPAGRCLPQLPHPFKAPVAAAVVHQNKLPPMERLLLHTADRLRNIFFCMIDRDNNRNQRLISVCCMILPVLRITHLYSTHYSFIIQTSLSFHIIIRHSGRIRHRHQSHLSHSLPLYAHVSIAFPYFGTSTRHLCILSSPQISCHLSFSIGTTTSINFRLHSDWNSAIAGQSDSFKILIPLSLHRNHEELY